MGIAILHEPAHEEAIELANEMRSSSELAKYPYSPDSLMTLEIGIQNLAKELDAPKLFKKMPSKLELLGVCELYGAYVGEVFRKTYNCGQWVKFSAVSPNLLPGYYIGIGPFFTYPAGEVLKQISKKQAGRVILYYHCLATDASTFQRTGTITPNKYREFPDLFITEDGVRSVFERYENWLYTKK